MPITPIDLGTTDNDGTGDAGPKGWLAKVNDVIAAVNAGVGVSVTDAGNGNIVIDPSPGTGTFTLDLANELSNINAIVSSADTSLTLFSGDPSNPGAAGLNILIGTSNGNDISDDDAGNGGNFQIIPGNGGGVTSGDGSGGEGGYSELDGGVGGSGFGTGNGGEGGGIVLTSGAGGPGGSSGNGGQGGDIEFTLGAPGTGGTPARAGQMFFGLPVGDPSVAGASYEDSITHGIFVSQGP